MDTLDLFRILLTILAIEIGVVATIVGWLWRHSTRLTIVETVVQNNSYRITDNANRTAADFSDIKGALVRIEELVGRQHAYRRGDN